MYFGVRVRVIDRMNWYACVQRREVIKEQCFICPDDKSTLGNYIEKSDLGVTNEKPRLLDIF